MEFVLRCDIEPSWGLTRPALFTRARSNRGARAVPTRGGVSEVPHPRWPWSEPEMQAQFLSFNFSNSLICDGASRTLA
jgi:hypothetical protein